MNRELTLYVFVNTHHAHAAGFRDSHDPHPQDAQARCFFPGADVNRLRGLRFARVIIAEGVSRAAADLGASNYERWRYAVHTIQANLTDEPRLWMEF